MPPAAKKVEKSGEVKKRPASETEEERPDTPEEKKRRKDLHGWMNYHAVFRGEKEAEVKAQAREKYAGCCTQAQKRDFAARWAASDSKGKGQWLKDFEENVKQSKTQQVLRTTNLYTRLFCIEDRPLIRLPPWGILTKAYIRGCLPSSMINNLKYKMRIPSFMGRPIPCVYASKA